MSVLMCLSHLVNALYLSNNRTTEIVDGAFVGLVNLQQLDLSFNSITGTSASAFLGLNHLERLFLSNNDVTLIPANIFNFLAKLHNFLDWCNIQISAMDNNAFSGLINLQKLYLQETIF